MSSAGEEPPRASSREAADRPEPGPRASAASSHGATAPPPPQPPTLTVDTFQAAAPHVTSAASPGEAHRPGQAQRVGGALPPAQKLPGAHGLPAAEVAPSPQPLPGAAVQGAQALAATAPVSALKVPAGQGTGRPLSCGQK